MPFTGIADPDTVAELRKVVDQYCLDNRIVHEEERIQVAFRVVSLFTSGMSMEDLKHKLAAPQHRSTDG